MLFIRLKEQQNKEGKNVKNLKKIICVVLSLAFAVALSSCGAKSSELTTENVKTYFDIDYGVDVAEKIDDSTGEKVYISEGQFFVSVAEKKSEYSLKDVELTFQVTYILYEGTDKEITKTKQIALEISDVLGNDMEMFFDTCTSTEGYQKISVKSAEVTAVKGSVKV